MSSDPNIPRSFISDAQNNLNIAARYISILNPLTIRRKGRKAKAFFALAMVCFFWGTTWIASREGVRHMESALQLAGIRQLLGGLCYVVFFSGQGGSMAKRKRMGPYHCSELPQFHAEQFTFYLGCAIYFGRTGICDRFHLSAMAGDHQFLWTKDFTEATHDHWRSPGFYGDLRDLL